jgi:cell division septation protein DedD
MKTENFTITTLTLGALLLAVPPAGAQILSVQTLEGTASIERSGIRISVSRDAPVIAKDVLRTESGARLVLRLAGQGELELGPDSELHVEKLPYADFATDLGSRLRLQQGSVQVGWHASTPWPLELAIGDRRYGIGQGEFRFQTDAEQQACIAHGALRQAPEGMAVPRCPGAVAAAGAAPTRPDRASPASKATYSRQLNREIRVEPPPATGRPDPQVRTSAPPAAPPPRLVPTAAVPSSGAWSVNVASVARREGAERMVRQLEQAGYRPVIVMAEVNGRITHRVQVPGYGSQSEAQAAARTLGEQLGIQDAWVVRSR